MVRSEGNISLKNPVTPPGIDPGTVRLVAQRLNHYTTPGPNNNSNLIYKDRIIEIKRMWTVKTKMRPVITGANGTTSKSPRKYLSHIAYQQNTK